MIGHLAQFARMCKLTGQMIYLMTCIAVIYAHYPFLVGAESIRTIQNFLKSMMMSKEV